MAQAPQQNGSQFEKTGKVQAWIDALRLRTLPLAASGVVIATGIAVHYDAFSWRVFVPMLLMALLMQILSNFADEYGDLVSGVDDETRLGPIRGLQRGDITKDEMKRVMIGTSILTMALVFVLLFASFGTSNWGAFAVFVLLGLASVGAAILYTVGPKPYGYIGLGDIMSFLFFGVVAVIGGAYLFTHELHASYLLPAFGLGFPVIAVLNLNNMRDCETDRAKGKITVANRLGDPGMRHYQTALLIAAMVLLALYPLVLGVTNMAVYAFVVGYFIWIRTIGEVYNVRDPRDFDRFMKPTSGGTVIVAFLFALCLGLFS